MQNNISIVNVCLLLAAIVLTAFIGPVYAQIPVALTDRISNGSGIIDLFADVNSSELDSYFNSTDGALYLGIDLNEAANGNESSNSVGVAIKSMELLISTTNGDFSFTEFFTNTTAMITEARSSQALEYYTLFGNAGSSSITGSSELNASAFDDVIELHDIAYSGEITSAFLQIEFLNTANIGANEEFFDYSAGFEEFAIFNLTQATQIELAAEGLDAAPSSIVYEETLTTKSSIAASEPTTDPLTPSGAPEPPAIIILAMFSLMYFRRMVRTC